MINLEKRSRFIDMVMYHEHMTGKMFVQGKKRHVQATIESIREKGPNCGAWHVTFLHQFFHGEVYAYTVADLLDALPWIQELDWTPVSPDEEPDQNDEEEKP